MDGKQTNKKICILEIISSEKKNYLTICQIVLLHFCFIFYLAQLNFIIINKSVLIILIKGYNIDNY